MRFVGFEETANRFRGKTVAVVGSGPSVLLNPRNFVDSHDVVVRVNNYRLGEAAGKRTDVHYSFYGRSIRKSAFELRGDGVKLCFCKCPDDMPLQSEWHIRQNKLNGIDFRYIYRQRAAFWFCDTFVPDSPFFLEKYFLLGKHVPTTGFSAIFDILACGPKSVYLTGFDFFTSGKHNVTDRWIPGHPEDPIGHRPDLEAAWLAENVSRYPLQLDNTLARLISRPFPELPKGEPRPAPVTPMHNPRHDYRRARRSQRARVVGEA